MQSAPTARPSKPAPLPGGRRRSLASSLVSLLFLAIASVLTLGCAVDPGPDLRMRLAKGERAAEDKARDAGRRPAAIVEFLGVEPGITVLDLIAASGYYTEVFAEAVGPDGLVYAQNNAFVLKIRDGRNDKALAARLGNDRLPNVRRLDREMDNLGLEKGSIDVAFSALNFHDVYDKFGKEAAVRFLRTVHILLKDEGVLGLIDHTGKAGADNKELHRITKEKVIEAALVAGFVVADESDVLRNPADDLSQFVFAEGMRGHTDRFVLKLRKANP